MAIVRPKFSDLQPTKVVYQAGDRVIARIQANLTPTQRRILESSINKYAGVELNILIVDCRNVALQLIRGSESTILADLSYSSAQQGNTVSFGCSKVELLPDDLLVAKQRIQSPSFDFNLKRWAGGIQVINDIW